MSPYRPQFSLLNALIMALALVAASQVSGAPRELADQHWVGVDRVVAIGDLHGDYEHYLQVLRDAGLINGRNKWSGGETHLVQTGDITDRGPDSIAIIDHLEGLKKQARRKGGRVHTLIGNHEAMNSYGDLRYVDPGEFTHFMGRNSKLLRQRQWEFTLQQLEVRDPEAFAAMDLEAYRIQWEENYPLGWVEHRSAWMPNGEYGQWMLGNPVLLQINDTLFLHAGISSKYCHLSVQEMNSRAHSELENYNPAEPGMIEDELGPLWYRGLVYGDPETMNPVVNAILARYQAERIVVGHTPTGGVIWPLHDGRVVAIDTGIAAYYGGHEAFLELGPGGPRAGYGDERLDLPSKDAEREAYLRAVMTLDPENSKLKAQLRRLLESQAGAEPGAGKKFASDADVAGPENSADEAPELSRDICL